MVTKLEIAKMIKQIDKKLLRVIIPEILSLDKSNRIQALDKVLEDSFNGEELKIKAIKIVANWKTPLKRHLLGLTFLTKP